MATRRRSCRAVLPGDREGQVRERDDGVARPRGQHLRHPRSRGDRGPARRASSCATSPACAATGCCSSGRSTRWSTWGAATTRAFSRAAARCCSTAARRLLVDERPHPGVGARDRQSDRPVRPARRRAQRARRQGRGARGRDPRLGPALARGGRAAGALAAGDRRAGGGVAEGRAALARDQPARSGRPRGRDRERDLAGRAGGARPVTGDLGAAERGAAGDDRRSAPRRGAQRVPDRALVGRSTFQP